MKILREIIRRLLIENQRKYDFLINLLVSNDIELITQGIELAHAVGYIEEVKHELEDAQGYVPSTHVWVLKSTPEFLARFMQLYPEPIRHGQPAGHTGSMTQDSAEGYGEHITIESHEPSLLR